MECFFEAQASFTEPSLSSRLKERVEHREWEVDISGQKNPWRVAQQKYFYKSFIKAGIALERISVRESKPSDDEISLITTCSKNVHELSLDYPLIVDRKKISKSHVDKLTINISKNYISKDKFSCFLPWLELCSELDIRLHKNTDFIQDICNNVRNCSNIKEIKIKFRGKDFFQIDDFEKKHSN